MAKWFVKTRDGEIGPYTSTEMRELVTAGRLTPRSGIRREDMTQWFRASSLKNLFPAGSDPQTGTVRMRQDEATPVLPDAPAAPATGAADDAPRTDEDALKAELGIGMDDSLFRDDDPPARPARPAAQARPAAAPGAAALFRDDGPPVRPARPAAQAQPAATPETAALFRDDGPPRSPSWSKQAAVPAQEKLFRASDEANPYRLPDADRQGGAAALRGEGNTVIDPRLPWAYVKLLGDASTITCWLAVTGMSVLAYLGWAFTLYGAGIILAFLLLPLLMAGFVGIMAIVLIMVCYAALWFGLAFRYLYRHCLGRCLGHEEAGMPLMHSFQAGISFFVVPILSVVMAFVFLIVCIIAGINPMVAIGVYMAINVVLQPMVFLSVAANSGDWVALSPHRFIPLVGRIGLPYWGGWGLYAVNSLLAMLLMTAANQLAAAATDGGIWVKLFLGLLGAAAMAQPLTFMAAVLGQVFHDTDVRGKTGVRRVGSPAGNALLVVIGCLAIVAMLVVPVLLYENEFEDMDWSGAQEEPEYGPEFYDGPPPP